jgi:hypothetical protein
MAVKKICEQQGEFELHRAEEECESFLLAPHRWNADAWPLHEDDAHFNRDSCIFTS